MAASDLEKAKPVSKPRLAFEECLTLVAHIMGPWVSFSFENARRYGAIERLTVVIM